MKAHNHIIILLTATCLFSGTIFADNNNKAANIRQFITDQNRQAIQQQQKMENELQKTSDVLKKSDDYLKQLKNENAKKLSALPKKQPVISSNGNGTVPECDCYDPNNQNNFPKNYLYNSKGNRTYQKKPYCKCEIKPISTIVTPTTNNQQPSKPAATKQKTDNRRNGFNQH